MPATESNRPHPLIALTFDDGPNTTTTMQILDLLEQYRLKASFFLIGNNITDATVPVIQRAHRLGCEINNHSVSHPNMAVLDREGILAEITPVTERIASLLGEPPRFFRPPFISTSELMYETIDLPFICGIGCEDWVPEISAKERVSMLRERVCDGAILLLHDFEGNENTVAALQTLLPEWLEAGYAFVTVSELFRQKGVTPSVHENVIYSVVG